MTKFGVAATRFLPIEPSFTGFKFDPPRQSPSPLHMHCADKMMCRELKPGPDHAPCSTRSSPRVWLAPTPVLSGTRPCVSARKCPLASCAPASVCLTSESMRTHRMLIHARPLSPERVHVLGLDSACNPCRMQPGAPSLSIRNVTGRAEKDTECNRARRVCDSECNRVCRVY